METLILQVGVKDGRLSNTVRCDGDSALIGRSFKCDVVLNDPFVSPEEVRLEKVEGAWFLIRKGYTNPVILNGQKIQGERVKIKSGDDLMLGRTHIHLFDESYQVAETKKLMLFSWLYLGGFKFLLPVVMIVCVCLLDVWMDYQAIYVDYQWKKPAQGAMYLSSVIIIWGSCWSLLGRLLRHQSHLASQVFFTAAMATLLVLLFPLAQIIEYTTNSSLFGEIAKWLIYFVVGKELLRFNLAHATNMSNPKLIANLFSFVLIVGAIAATNFNKAEFSRVPVASMVLKAPVFKVTKGVDAEKYVNEYSELFTELAEGLQEEEKESGFF